jgi:hypothetical protein
MQGRDARSLTLCDTCAWDSKTWVSGRYGKGEEVRECDQGVRTHPNSIECTVYEPRNCAEDA